MNRFRLLALLALAWAFPVSAQDWGEIAQISTTLGVQANRLCLGEGSRGDIGCPSYAPYVNATSGYVGIGTTNPQSALHVNGALRTSADASQTSIWLPNSGALRTGTNGTNIYFDVGTAWFRDGAGSNANAGVRIAGNIGVGIITPSTTLHTIGSLRLGIETSTTMNTCDANRAGTIRWHEGAGQFQVCYGSGGWATLSSAATSGSTIVSALNDLTDAATSSTINSMFIGHEGGSFGANDIQNTATGVGALDALNNSTAAGNSAFGYNALTNNSSGDNNNAFGSYALTQTTTGSNNAAFGSLSLRNNTTGGNNTALNGGLQSNTSGGNNIAIGYIALDSQQNSTGQIAIGNEAMRYVSGTSADAATGNTALGYSALKGNSNATDNTGDYNTAVGYLALVSNTSGSYNTAIGTQSLYSTITGSQNTALGRNAGYGLVTGSSNILIGYGADTPANNTSNFLNIGNAISGTYTTGGVINFLAGIKSAGVVTATYFEGDGSRLTNLAVASSDRIVSGTTEMVASTGGISVTFGVTPSVRFDAYSGMSVFARDVPSGDTYWTANPSERVARFMKKGNAYVQVLSRDNEGVAGLEFFGAGQRGRIYGTATYDMFISPNDQYGATNIIMANQTGANSLRVGIGGLSTSTPVATLDVSGSVKVAGTGSETCGPTTRGSIRQNPATRKLEVCRY